MGRILFLILLVILVGMCSLFSMLHAVAYFCTVLILSVSVSVGNDNLFPSPQLLYTCTVLQLPTTCFSISVIIRCAHSLLAALLTPYIGQCFFVAELIF
jgi:hypothetical protein